MRPLYHLERYPLAPLAEAVARAAGVTEATVPMIAVATGMTERAVHRWRHLGLTYVAADRAATRLGLHPGRIWPGWWTPPVAHTGQFVTVV